MVTISVAQCTSRQHSKGWNATSVSPRDSGEYPLFMSSRHSRTLHEQKQRWVIPRGRGTIFIAWMPLRFCNQITVIRQWEEQIA